MSAHLIERPTTYLDVLPPSEAEVASLLSHGSISFQVLAEEGVTPMDHQFELQILLRKNFDQEDEVPVVPAGYLFVAASGQRPHVELLRSRLMETRARSAQELRIA